VLAYDCTKNQQFWTKTDQNFVFLGCDPHIADQLYKTAPYMSFYRFWKNSNFRSKSISVRLRFTENHLFGAKIDQNSVFLGYDPHIVDRLYIMIPYMSFYEFWKNSNFRSKSVAVSIWFYQKSLVWGQKLTEALYFLVLTPILWIGYTKRSRICVFMDLKKYFFVQNP
jgi:hypothetical protein